MLGIQNCCLIAKDTRHKSFLPGHLEDNLKEKGDSFWMPSRKRDESNQSVELPAKNQAAIELLRSWREDDEYDEEEQKATWEFLKQALDEDRLSDRKLFP